MRARGLAGLQQARLRDRSGRGGRWGHPGEQVPPRKAQNIRPRTSLFWANMPASGRHIKRPQVA